MSYRPSSPNRQQLDAVQTTNGPVLIIAGPGSGKTFTLVERVVYLITQMGATPESLLVVTFTDKAAAELTTRISNRLNQLGLRFNLNEMYLGTFHSICLRVPPEAMPAFDSELQDLAAAKVTLPSEPLSVADLGGINMTPEAAARVGYLLKE